MAEENTTPQLADDMVQSAEPNQSTEEDQETTPTMTQGGSSEAQTMNDLVASGAEIRVLKPGDMVEGSVISISKNEIYIDLHGYGIGVVRGRELYDDQATLASLSPGDAITASVVETENGDGNVELSLRQAGHERVWQKLRELMESKEIVTTRILAANKGGLMAEVNNITGFLPVSQLSIEHYPRVEEGDKNRILNVLNTYVGQDFHVQVITADSAEEKLIVSEKAVYKEALHKKLSELAIGEIYDGHVTGVVDFGIFVKFGADLEGLVHISELAWQRVEDPKDLFNVGDPVKIKVIAIEKGRVSLSIKQLQPDPWLESVKQFNVGQTVKGKISKIVPFGVFVDLDNDVQGLAHLGELSHDTLKSADEVVKEGDEKEFQIISIEPAEHRLGLSLKALTPAPKKKKAEVSEDGATESSGTPKEENSSDNEVKATEELKTEADSAEKSE